MTALNQEKAVRHREAEVSRGWPPQVGVGGKLDLNPFTDGAKKKGVCTEHRGLEERRPERMEGCPPRKPGSKTNEHQAEASGRAQRNCRTSP